MKAESRETLRLSEINTTDDDRSSSPGPKHKSSGCHLTVAQGFILTFFALTIAVLIGVVVHFAGSNGGECRCEFPTRSEEERWAECAVLAEMKGVCMTEPPCDGPRPSPTDEPPLTGPTSPTTPAPTTTRPTPTDVRLPLRMYPLHYDLELQPDIYTGDPTTFTFSGFVTIYMTCRISTSSVVLHSNIIDILKVRENDKSGTELNFEKDQERQFLTIEMGRELAPNENFTVYIKFESDLKNDLVGLYYSTYQINSETRYLATTQMQPTDARKTFPCFDEPQVKATFSVTLVRKTGKRSLSNMQIKDEQTRNDDWMADVYDPTVKMSTYLLAFIVCDFNYKNVTTNGGTDFRVWARPDAVDQTDYALQKGNETLTFFEEYFNISFPLPKQDMIAVPDFAAGAMENWGLIIYRETALLYDPQLSSASNKQRVAEVVVHELAHQWFGNLVTPNWWDDLWLNEGFASYMEYVGMSHIEKDWNMHDQFVERDLQSVLLIDSLSTSHPIYVEVNHPDEINEIFDRISYLKGSSIIRMMNFFLGDDSFRQGLSNYLKTFEYSTAHHTDLWKHLNDARPADLMLDVGDIMNTWVLQMGYPVVLLQLEHSTVTVFQEHFLTNKDDPPTKPSDYNYQWTIPLTVATDNTPKPDWLEPQIHWMQHTQSNMALTLNDTNNAWVLGNIGVYGYYRVNYDLPNWEALIIQLAEDHEVIPVKNRAALIDDSINLGRADYIDQLIGLRVTGYLMKEKEYVPLKVASDAIAYFSNMLKYSRYYGDFKRFRLNQMLPIYNEVGPDPGPSANEGLLDKYKRGLSWGVACNYGHQPCRMAASDALTLWMADPTNETIIPADMKSVMYCYGIKNGGVNEWNFLYNKYNTSNVAAERSRILRALSCSDETWILSRYLEYALDDKVVRQQDAVSVISYIASNDIGRYIAWDFFRRRFDEINEKWGTGFFQMSNLIRGVTANFNTDFDLEQMLAFREQHPNLGSGTRAFDQAIETTRSNIIWMERNEEKLGEWLKIQ